MYGAGFRSALPSLLTTDDIQPPRICPKPTQRGFQLLGLVRVLIPFATNAVAISIQPVNILAYDIHGT